METKATPRRVAVLFATLTCTVSLLIATTLPATAATFGTPVVVSSLNDSEPGVDVASDGTIYVNAIPGIGVPGPTPSHLWRSDNGGTSWTLTPPGARAALPGGGDFDIDVDKSTGAIYGTDLWLGSATVSSSTNKGLTWIANPYSTPVQDRQWVATAGGGRVYHATHQIPSGLIVAKSIDGGISYPTSHVAATPADQTGCICPPGTLIAEGAGLLGDKVGLIYATSTGGIKFARSTNGALSFSQTVVSPSSSADTVSAFPIVTNAGADKLAAAWMEIVGNRSRVKVAISSNWGQTWSIPVTLVSDGTSLYPWIAARGNKIGVSLFHTSATATPSTVPEAAAWYERYIETTNFGFSWSALTTIDSTPVKSGPICTEGINCEADRELGDFQALTMDNLGNAHVVWARSINGATDTEIRFVRQQ